MSMIYLVGNGYVSDYISQIKIEVENFPAFLVIDNKGNDFFDI